ncbi:hypothetical protein F4859DRAFT_224838 [Xylaria cf. heliscus]|nr:hypothetical protein F4859DRAFT_224838 [Xylaria cf. heliscus]
MASSPFPSSGIPSRRDHLHASLKALLSDDDIDLDLFRPGASWPLPPPPSPRPPPAPAVVSPSSVSTEREPDTFLSGGAVSGEHIAIDPLLSTEMSLAACNPNQEFARLFSLQPQSATSTSGSGTMLTDPPAGYPRHGRQVRAAIPRKASNAKRSRSHFYQGESVPARATQTIDPRLRVDDLAVDYGGSRLPPRETDAENPVAGESDLFSSPHAIDFAYIDGWGQSPAASPDQAQPSSSSPDSGVWDLGQTPEKRQRQHYAVEKRYRAGLNERFNMLRDCIEARRKMKSQRRPNQPGAVVDAGNSAKGGGGGGGGPMQSPAKINKAEVLHEAVVYIQDLEEENEVVLEHLKLLVHRLRNAKVALGVTEPKQAVLNRKDKRGGP